MSGRRPSRFAFRRRTARYWTSLASVRELYIGGLRRWVDVAEAAPTAEHLQLVGDFLANGVPTHCPAALGITWSPRNRWERECWELRREYAIELERVRQLLGRLAGDPELQGWRDTVLIFFAQHCNALNFYWTAPPAAVAPVEAA
jgi:hypothetical protein